MREVMTEIEAWRTAGQPVGIATVVQAWGSAPRKAGAKMAMTADGSIAGSVSGGCVEGAVFEETVAAMDVHQPKLLQFGVADETAWEVGLACGGNIRVFVQMLNDEIYTAVQKLIHDDRAGGLGTVVVAADDDVVGRQVVVDGDGAVVGWADEAAVTAVRQALADGKTTRVMLDDETELFVEVYLPAPQLIMVGGVHIAVALTEMAKVLGYHTIVIDPRRAFGSQERFPHVDTLIQQWPDSAFGQVTVNENTAVALLTHDPKIDDPALAQVLDGPAFYIGALGSSRTHAKRVKRLEEAGYTAAQIERIHGPIGLDIGARNPEEIALAVLAEIVQARRR